MPDSSINKADVVDALIKAIFDELNDATAASKDAADYATNEESRAESQWDTQGLEASYLAAGQAGQARKWAEALSVIKGTKNELCTPLSQVQLGALIECNLNGIRDYFFLAPAGGGIVIQHEDLEITVITPQSPIALQLLGKTADTAFTLPNGLSAKIVSVG